MKRIAQFMMIFVLFSMITLNVEAEEVVEEQLAEQIEILDEEERPGDSNLVDGFSVPVLSWYTADQFTEKYGNQLEGLELEVYQALGSFEDFSSVQSIDFDLGDAFSFETTYGELKAGTYKESEAYNQVRMDLRSKVFRASDAFCKDRIDMYWLRTVSYQGTISYGRTESMTDETIVTAKISKIKIKPAYYYDEIFGEMEMVEDALSTIMAELDACEYEDRYELLRGMYQLIIDLAEYNHSDLTAASNHTLTGILLEKYGHKGTCEGYAKIIKWLCDAYGIPNALVIGGDSMDMEGNLIVNHCWNVVMMEDGNWYMLDATWDDTGSNNQYFLVGEAETSQNHRTSPFFSYTEYEPFVLPILAESTYKPVVINVGTVSGVRTYAVGKNKVKLEWSAVEKVDGYLVYGHKNGIYGYVGMTTDQTSYIDYKALDEDYNFYWVFPFLYGKNGKMHVGSCEKYVYQKGVCPAVAEFKAQSVNGGVKLTWKASRDAEGYLIYGRVNGKDYGYVGMTKGMTYTDMKASRFVWNYYWVFPYYRNADGDIITGGVARYVYGKAL